VVHNARVSVPTPRQWSMKFASSVSSRE